MKDNLLRVLKRKSSEDDKDKVRLDSDALVIDCRSCGFAPEPASRECFRCMVDSMSCAGGTERIIMRTGKDIEVSGTSGEVIRRIASLKRWSIPMQDGNRECRRCDTSRKEVFSKLWENFPDLDFQSAMESLESGGDKEDCSMCLRSSRRALEQLRIDMDSVNDLMKVRL